MKFLIHCFIVALSFSILSCEQRPAPALFVKNLTCEYTVLPSGIDTPSPALGWQLLSDERHVVQTAYQVLVSDSYEYLLADNGNYWNSGKVTSRNSLSVLYDGRSLQSATTYYWKVKVWDNHGNVSAWSEPQTWQMGLLFSDAAKVSLSLIHVPPFRS